MDGVVETTVEKRVEVPVESHCQGQAVGVKATLTECERRLQKQMSALATELTLQKSANDRCEQQLASTAELVAKTEQFKDKESKPHPTEPADAGHNFLTSAAGEAALSMQARALSSCEASEGHLRAALQVAESLRERRGELKTS